MVILIDLDGTLVDSLPLLYQTYCRLLERYDKHPSRKEFDEINGPALVEGLALLKERHNLPYDVGKLYEELLSMIQSRYVDEVELHAGAREFLSSARDAGVKLAVVTSAIAMAAEKILVRHDIRQYFDHVVTAEGVERSKPHPAIYQRALEVMEVGADRAIAIEDSANGVLSATGARIPTIWMTEREVEPPSGVVAVVRSWDEVSAWFRAHRGAS